MSRRVKRGTYRRRCSRCFWEGTYDTAARGDYAKRRHSCRKREEAMLRQALAEDRRALVDRTPKPCLHKQANHQHGERATYVLDKCRCHPCSQANSEAQSWRTRQKAYGRYNRYVNAAPVREHVRDLQAAGLGLKTIAKRAGVATGTMSKLMFGVYAPSGSGGGRAGKGDLIRPPSRRVLRETAEKLYALDPAWTGPLPLADGATIDGRDTRLRLRALVALGYSMSDLGRRLDITNIHNTVHGTANGHPGDALVQVGTAKAVEALFEQLCMTLPPRDTWHQRTNASRARNYAKAHGWAPPLALDDLAPYSTAGLDEAS